VRGRARAWRQLADAVQVLELISELGGDGCAAVLAQSNAATQTTLRGAQGWLHRLGKVYVATYALHVLDVGPCGTSLLA
jgi:hypothetical protein